MEQEMLASAWDALQIVMDPSRMMFMALGVFFGLILGIIPGLGGVVGMTMLLPFTYHMDPYAAVAMMLGLGAVTTTSDTIPAVLFGVPGTTGSAATVLDGHPLAKQGQAGRALGAAFMASLLGGVLGAFLLALSVPVLRPALLAIASPELLAMCVFGISLAAALSGGAVFKGLAAGAFGLMITTIGADFLTGTMRWTFRTIYLWDGIPLVPIALGIFAIPELVDMAISRTRLVSGDNAKASTAGQWQGVKDVFRHKFLVVRCAGIGAALGSVPGVGTSVIDWIAYGHAARSEKGALETFGKGDIRGVIASESSNNAKEGGALVPTIAFGVPGSASMAILLGMFLLHGIVPGPDMLSKQLDLTYTMVWTVALANILGAGVCFIFANQLAKIVSVRPGILVPGVMAIIFLGALQGSHDWGDLYVLLASGALGWIMKRIGWPRPPLILGVVLGALVEKYLFISVQAYGASFLLRPVVLVILAITAFGILRPVMARRVARSGDVQPVRFAPERIGTPDAMLAIVFIAIFSYALATSYGWPFSARIVPQIVSTVGLICALIQFAMLVLVRDAAGGPSPARAAVMDIRTDFEGLSRGDVALRGAVTFGWLAIFLAAALVVGVLPAAALYMAMVMRFSSLERWRVILPTTLGVIGGAYFLFHYLLITPWPGALMGVWFPALRNAVRLF